MDTYLSKSKSNSIKFISVLLMILLHTFCFPDRIKYSYIPLFNIFGIPIEQYIASGGGICVGMFLLLSGYGLYKTYNKGINYKGIIKRIFIFYRKYWLVFILFIPLGFYLGVYNFELKNFLKNFFAVQSSYNNEWWFARLYLELLLIYPIIIKYILKYNNRIVLGVYFLISILGYAIPKVQSLLGNNSVLIYEFSIFLGGQFLFMLGIIIAKNCLFTRLRKKVNCSTKEFILHSIVIYIVIVLLGYIPVLGEIAKLIFIPFFIFVLGGAIKEESILSRLGTHSTNMWLIHSFFCYYYFQQFTFMLKYC